LRTKNRREASDRAFREYYDNGLSA
jgi:hypothetical protein